MNHYFADTFYWIALSNRRDQWYQRVQALNRTLTSRHFYTTEEVLGEFLDFCGGASSETRRRAALFTQRALTDPYITVFPQTHTSFLEGLALYETRPDKAYSLTDCISMQAMRREGLTYVLTNDRHFTQEGFHILFS